jgi:hypothetical protein
MPTGHFGHISLVVQILMKVQPKSILDIGIGYGKYGMLAREYLDYAHFKKREILIDGIEGFGEYIQDGQRFYYDQIYVGDARVLLSTLAQYDMILLLDTLEHFTRDDGLQILKTCQSKAKYILVATPRDLGVQGLVYGNEFECHRFQWRKKDLLPFGPVTFFNNPDTLIALIGARSGEIKGEIVYLNFKNFIKSNFPRIYSLLKKIRGASA